MSAPRQRGIALLIVLIALLLVAGIATRLAWVGAQSLRRAGTAQHLAEARLRGLSAEAWARSLLAQDGRTTATDHPGEAWATLPPVLPFEGGELRGRIVDLGGRFNLNTLLNADGSVNEEALALFQGLLAALDIDPQRSAAVLDWLDADAEPRPGGAEDAQYALLARPRATGNRPFVDFGELGAVQGFDAAMLARLAPHVTALPIATPINVNTASGLLLGLLLGYGRGSAQAALQLEQARPLPGYASEQAFLAQRIAVAPRYPLALNSRCFRLEVQIDLAGVRVMQRSLLIRPDEAGRQAPLVLWRSFDGMAP
ncbi:MAG TPA: type II secretion system minor pseudopilin GspK [Plasticicumulans sp.]|nr:type II secretion system minor pseudopilin GspK [Plasticicumulans sp.]